MPALGANLPKPADCEATYTLKAHGATGENDQTKFKISSNPALEGNQYHCFYCKPPYAAGSGMLWYDSIIDNKARLHRWILYATENATHASGTSAACNAAEPGAYFVAGWAPGANNPRCRRMRCWPCRAGGVWPHMHKAARRQKVVIKRRSGMPEVLHDEPFDFNAQIFFPKGDIVVRAEDTIETSCYDDNDTSQPIKYGERTQDTCVTRSWPPGRLVRWSPEAAGA